MIDVQQCNSGLNNIKAYSVNSNNMVQAFAMPVYSNPVNNGIDTVQINSNQNKSTESGNWFSNLVNLIKQSINKNARLSDDAYRTELANTLGCKAENLASIVGPDELKMNLSKYKKEDFSTGNVASEDFEKRFKGVLNGDFLVSLHNHTHFSDGFLNVGTFLDYAAHYADKVAKMREEKGIKSDLPCFMVAVTDHDTLEGAKEAAKLIAQNPAKYKNLKVVLGLEQGATIKTDYLKKPVIIEILGYCLNPFDKDINSFLAKLQKERMSMADKGIAEVNKYGYNYTLDGMRSESTTDNLLRRGVSKKFMLLVKQYLDKVTNKQHSSEINAIFPDDKSDTPPIEKVMDVFRNNRSGIFGLAHPLRVDLEKNIIPEKVQAPIGNDKIQQSMYMLLSSLKEIGVTAAESNYQYVKEFYDSKNDEELIQNVRNCCEALGLDKTGGNDGHEDILTHSHNVHYTLNGNEYKGYLPESHLKYLMGVPAAQQAVA